MAIVVQAARLLVQASRLYHESRRVNMAVRAGWCDSLLQNWSEARHTAANHLEDSQTDRFAQRSLRSCAGCTARMPVKWLICIRHEKPGATTTLSGPIFRRAGKSRCSPTSREIS